MLYSGRKDFLRWMNHTLQTDVKDISQLQTGVHFCMLLEIAHPGAITFRLIYTDPTTKVQRLYNLKKLDEGFTKSNIERTFSSENIA